ncbi:MAG TPA: rhomboid family intramembrane serine protease [Bryobacteraceae bacterium]|nr:rhomboid family intramembrane serine protease [Bryobacteraceae bacterium]
MRSSERTNSTASALLIIIVLNILVFLYEISLPRYALNAFIVHYGIVPDRFHYYTLISSMFMHGGFLHILGNMWFLWVFGRNIEDLLGHERFVVFYLLCGLAAGFADVLANPGSPVPTVGASGAIAGVMGAYLIKFPRAHIVTLVPIIIFITTLDIPAAFLLLYWFAIQFFSGVGSIGDSRISHGDVAWFAHVGGFLAGMALIHIMTPERRRIRSWNRDI